MDWGEAEARQVAAALGYAATHCAFGEADDGFVNLRFEGNAFGEEGRRTIEAAVDGCSSFGQIYF